MSHRIFTLSLNWNDPFGFSVERRRARNEQYIFNWNKVTRKTLSAAVCMDLSPDQSRVERRSALNVDHEDKLALETVNRFQIGTKRGRVFRECQEFLAQMDQVGLDALK